MDECTIVTTIGRPVEDVFAVIQNVARTPVWTPGLTQVRQASEGPLGPGATLIYRGTFFGRSCDTPAVCTAFGENKQFATKSTAGPLHIEIDTTVEPVAAGTQVTSFCRGESRGFLKLAEPLVVRLGKKHFETAWDNLRALLEDHAL
jgi:hypothetical protein